MALIKQKQHEAHPNVKRERMTWTAELFTSFRLTPSQRDGLPDRAFLTIQTVILASHVIITAYGFWLPNDERGSWSDFIRSWELLRYGPATPSASRSDRKPYNRERQTEMRKALNYPSVRFTGKQALWIGRAFAQQVEKSGFKIYACAILREHVHLVIARHRFDVEQVTNLLKGAATKMLTRMKLHPMREVVAQGEALPSPWASGLWKVFLDSRADIRRSIDYVNDNPDREGIKRQEWSFVTEYEF